MARKAVERNISYDDVRQLYYVSMELGRDENGKRIKQYRTFPTLTAARNGLRDFHTQRERQAREPQDEVREEMDLAHWLEYWMESIVRPNRAETTVYAYQKIIDNHILPALGGIPMSRLSAKRIQRYYTDTQQAAGLSSNTMRRHHDLLSSALRSAVRQDMLLASPMDRVEPPRSRVKEAFFYDNEELKQLYQLIEGHILELAVKMAGSLGMRREEICGLKWENVDFRRLVLVREARTAYGATIVQKETKNRASVRTLYLPEEVLLLLGREQERQEEERARQGAVFNRTDHVILDHKGALLPKRPLPGLHPVCAEKRPAPPHLPRPAAHLCHHRLLSGGLPVRHREGPGPLHPRHHGADLYPSGGPHPRGPGAPGVRRPEMRGTLFPGGACNLPPFLV